VLSLGDQVGDSLTAALPPPPGDMTEGARDKDRNEGDLATLAWVVAAATSPLVRRFGEAVVDQTG